MKSSLWVLLILFGGALSAQVQPVPYGHAHNDYLHERPLFEALDNGFTSIEIDVYLHKGKLKVSHLPFGLNKKKSIEELYLDPIREVIAKNGGTVYRGYDVPVILMVDFKAGRNRTYAKLVEVLKQYRDMITIYQDDSVIVSNPIQILITGNKPFASVIAADGCLMTIDAHTSVLTDSLCSKVVTRYSDPWEKRIGWNGKGEMPNRKREKLEKLISLVHNAGKPIRFYQIPDTPEVWKILLDAGVDWINTDRITAFSRFLKAYQKK